MNELIRQLLQESHSEDEVRRFLSFTPNSQQADAAIQYASDALLIFKPRPGACLLMSALLCLRLIDSLHVPAYVIVGSLQVRGVTVFGSETPPKASEFDTSNFSWDGHAWVHFGQNLIDLSLGRTASSGKGHPALTSFFRNMRPQALVGPYEAFAREGLVYCPQRVLKEAQVENFARAALAFARGQIDLPGGS
jgi:hypothetical protein